MLNFLKSKEAVLKQKTLKLLKNKKVTSNAIIKSVAILTSEEHANNYNLQAIVQQKLKIKNSQIFVYKKFQKNIELSPENFTDKSISKNGKINDEIFNIFLENSFDLLICFFDKKSTYLEYVSLLSKAKYKVGFAELNLPFLDLEIKTTAEKGDEFFLELKKYLVILKKLKI